MFEIFARTDVGLVREHNEDAFLVNETVVIAGELHIKDWEEGFTLAIADGVGGLNAGEVASRNCLINLSQINVPISNEKLDYKIKETSLKILEYGRIFPDCSSMGTTLAGITCHENKVTCFHVGDSRIYRLRGGFLRQLTVDDSLVQVLYESGKITREDMSTHPDRHIILQTIGQEKSNRELDTHIEDVRSPFEPGDVFLICSDGLTDMVSEDEIEEVLVKQDDLSVAVRELITLAKEAGGVDNITVVAVRKPDK